jgi:hypothetical protein
MLVGVVGVSLLQLGNPDHSHYGRLLVVVTVHKHQQD